TTRASATLPINPRKLKTARPIDQGISFRRPGEICGRGLAAQAGHRWTPPGNMKSQVWQTGARQFTHIAMAGTSGCRTHRMLVAGLVPATATAVPTTSPDSGDKAFTAGAASGKRVNRMR